jgi:hypothetical protein
MPAPCGIHAQRLHNLHNPAPGLRATQVLGDQIFNNGSPLGAGYHTDFGSRKPNIRTVPTSTQLALAPKAFTKVS